MTLVIIGSLILHAISILAIIILYLRQNQYAQSEKTMQKLQKDVEDVLQSFLLEIQEENKQLAATVHQKGAKYADQANTEKSVEDSHHRTSTAPAHAEVTVEAAKIYPSVSSVKKAYQQSSSQETKNIDSYEPLMPDVEDQLDISISSYESENEKLSFKAALDSQLKQQAAKTTEERAIEMMKDGYNVEDIAKVLGKGKTEIELLLKFNHKHA